MPQPPAQPHLTPQFCFSTSALKEFLRVSRGAIDDSITQNLNALVTPAKQGFDPSSTSQLGPRTLSRSIDPQSCQTFKDKVLFPSWQTRSDALSYCAVVASSDDPDDPDAMAREVELERNRERVVDERFDPYSARFFPRSSRTERLAMVLRQEKGVENIVRSRSWEIVKERCEEPVDDWEQALASWRKTKDDA